MADFKPITSQEDLDNIISARLNRAEESWKKRYADYSSPEDVKAVTEKIQKQVDALTEQLNAAHEKAATYEKEIAEKDGKIKGYEVRSVKSKIAHDAGLGYDAIDFLRGETEEDIKASADALKALMGANRHAAPLADPESGKDAGGDSAYSAMADALVKGVKF